MKKIIYKNFKKLDACENLTKIWIFSLKNRFLDNLIF